VSEQRTEVDESSFHQLITHAEDSGPTHAGDFSVEWRGLHPVPEESRYGRPLDLVWFWFAMQLFPVAFFLGALAAESFIGLSFWQGTLAIVLGNVLASAVVGGLSVMGPRTGAAQLPLARAPFGKTVTVVGVLAYVVSIVFLALGAVYGAQALQVVFGGIPFTIALLIVFALEAAISIVGYELLHRYQRLTALLSGLGFLAIAIEVLTKTDKIHISQAVHGASWAGSFVLMTAIAFSFGIGWAPNAADYCRYLPTKTSGRSLFWCVFAGLTFGCVAIEVLGLATANLLATNVSQMKAVFDLMSGGALGYAVMIAICIGVVANIAATDYSAGLQMISTGLRIPRPVMTGISAVIAFALTEWLHSGNLLHKAENLILIVTYWVGPFVAIVAIQWWRASVESHIKAVTTPIKSLPWGWQAFVALAVGFVACLPFSNTSEGATLAEHGGILKALFGSLSNDMHGADLAYPIGALVGGLTYAVLAYATRHADAPEVVPRTVGG
jgi:NCS1 family nucleobase:cation symporter-1